MGKPKFITIPSQDDDTLTTLRSSMVESVMLYKYSERNYKGVNETFFCIDLNTTTRTYSFEYKDAQEAYDTYQIIMKEL